MYIWGVPAALTWVGFCQSSDLLQLAMLLIPGVKQLFPFRHILEARFKLKLKFHRDYRMGNRFLKFLWHNYIDISYPQPAEGLCAPKLA